MIATIVFVAAKSAETLLRPSALLLLSSVLGFVLLARRRPRAGLALIAWPVAFQLVLAVVPFDNWALASLEDRFPPLRDVPPDPTGIVVLGGAVDTALTRSWGMPSLNGAAERMTAFVALARTHPDARLAFTGGSGRIVRGDLSEADVARMLFDELGLAGRDVVYEDRSRTTWENAVFLARLIHPHAGQTWILLTSAVHMPRAMGAFRAAGWPVIADPVGFKSAPSFAVALEPTLPERLSRLDQAAHEWIGLIVYRVLGRTKRLLPRP